MWKNFADVLTAEAVDLVRNYSIQRSNSAIAGVVDKRLGVRSFQARAEMRKCENMRSTAAM